jgi:hypothetical protein
MRYSGRTEKSVRAGSNPDPEVIMRRSIDWRVPRAGLVLGLSLWTAGSARAVDTVLKNDSVVDLGQVAIQAGFVQQERAAAWLSAVCDGDLVAVRILWLSATGGSGQTLGEAITISEAGAPPVPGTQLREMVGPVLTDGFFNELPVAPPIPLAAGETVVVDFRFLTTPPPTGPSVVTDIDGCQVTRNGIFAIPPSSWFDACTLGVSGDFAIRAVQDCPEGLIFQDGFESGTTNAWTSVSS